MSDSKERIVAVTGASGFIGSHLCRRLTANGWAVRKIPREEAVGGTSKIIPALLHGADVLVHLAGMAHVAERPSSKALENFVEANVAPTQSLLETAIDVGVDKVLYMSSIAAVVGTSDAIVTEEMRPDPISAYGKSKLQSEDLVRALCARTSTRQIILRPPMVYGPGMKGNPLRLFDLINRSIPLPLGSIRNRRSMIYVGNLVAAIESLMEEGGHWNETYLVADNPPHSTTEFVVSIARSLNKMPRLFRVPEGAMKKAASLGDIASYLIPFPLTSRVVDQLWGSLELNVTKLSARTRYIAPYSFETGLEKTARWFASATNRRASPVLS